MSHDTHTHHVQEDKRPGSSFTSAIWFVILVVGLFVAAVNFVDVMSHDDGGHDAGHATEHAAPAGHGKANHDAQGHEGTEEHAPAH